MKRTIQLSQTTAQESENPRWDRLNAVTGIMWGSLLGSTFWLLALALIFTG